MAFDPDPAAFLDPTRMASEVKAALASSGSLIKVMGKALAVNWNTVGDTQIVFPSSMCIPVFLLNTNFVNVGNGSGSANLFSGPNGSGNEWGNADGTLGSYQSDVGANPPDLNSATVAPIGGAGYASSVYIHVSVPDGGSPDPLSDVYILGIDLSALS